MHEIDKERFGAFLARLRKERGMTQRELAGRLHVSDKAVSKWERGAEPPGRGPAHPPGRLPGSECH